MIPNDVIERAAAAIENAVLLKGECGTHSDNQNVIVFTSGRYHA